VERQGISFLAFRTLYVKLGTTEWGAGMSAVDWKLIFEKL